MDADVFDLGEIEVSNDGKSFQSILLSDIESFDFQYVRIRFIDTLKNSKSTLFAPTKIKDILFYKKKPNTYLIKSLTALPITIYSQVNCKNEDINQLLSHAHQT
jgi:hypothetical protein